MRLLCTALRRQGKELKSVVREEFFFLGKNSVIFKSGLREKNLTDRPDWQVEGVGWKDTREREHIFRCSAFTVLSVSSV
jgi:hypothetical protein